MLLSVPCKNEIIVYHILQYIFFKTGLQIKNLLIDKRQHLAVEEGYVIQSAVTVVAAVCSSLREQPRLNQRILVGILV